MIIYSYLSETTINRGIMVLFVCLLNGLSISNWGRMMEAGCECFFCSGVRRVGLAVSREDMVRLARLVRLWLVVR